MFETHCVERIFDHPFDPILVLLLLDAAAQCNHPIFAGDNDRTDVVDNRVIADGGHRLRNNLRIIVLTRAEQSREDTHSGLLAWNLTQLRATSLLSSKSLQVQEAKNVILGLYQDEKAPS